MYTKMLDDDVDVAIYFKTSYKALIEIDRVSEMQKKRSILLSFLLDVKNSQLETCHG